MKLCLILIQDMNFTTGSMADFRKYGLNEFKKEMIMKLVVIFILLCTIVYGFFSMIKGFQMVKEMKELIVIGRIISFCGITLVICGIYLMIKQFNPEVKTKYYEYSADKYELKYKITTVDEKSDTTYVIESKK